MEKTVIRPTAFKPVIPKSRNSMQYLSPRHDRSSLSDSQNNLNLLSPGSQTDTLSPCSEKRTSYSGGRHVGGGSQTCSMSDSGRNSLSSLPPYGSIPYNLPPADTPLVSCHLEPMKTAPGNVHGHSNSDSGRSSSSKSTGSVSGRGQPLSDSGSSERSPAPVEGGYEGVVRDLEDKLRERDVELQQLRDNLDENEVAICQVRGGVDGPKSIGHIILSYILKRMKTPSSPLSLTPCTITHTMTNVMTYWDTKTITITTHTHNATLTYPTRLSSFSRFMRRSRSAVSWSWRSCFRAAPRGCRLSPRRPSVTSRCSSCRSSSCNRRRRSSRRTLARCCRRGRSWRSAVPLTSTRRFS